jgi:hypothetical protein
MSKGRAEFGRWDVVLLLCLISDGIVFSAWNLSVGQFMVILGLTAAANVAGFENGMQKMYKIACTVLEEMVKKGA